MSERFPVQSLTISGFRGILQPFRLCFTKGGSSTPYSMFVYGRNGTGKSSITDAWEWLQNGRIGHLRREGAQESAYQHIDAEEGQSYVELELADPGSEAIRVEFDPSRVRTPRVMGDIEELRKCAPHPCQLRFEDLTRFVYCTKAEKHDELARLMGFEPQVEFQKALRRVERLYGETVEAEELRLGDLESELIRLLSLDALHAEDVLASLNEIADRHGLPKAASVAELEPRLEVLRARVEHDQEAAELSSVGIVVKGLGEFSCPGDLGDRLAVYVEGCGQLRESEGRLLELVRLTLYEVGADVLERIEQEGGDAGICPLCGSRVEGNVLTHVRRELESLTRLKETRDGLDSTRKHLTKSLATLKQTAESVASTYREQGAILSGLGVSSPPALARLMASCTALMALLKSRPEVMEPEQLRTAEAEAQALTSAACTVVADVAQAVKRTTVRKEELESSSRRTRLVQDHELLQQGLRRWTQICGQQARVRQHASVQSRLKRVVDDYMRSSVDDVQRRFSDISEALARYFGILESGSECLASPVLRMRTDQDRAVELEIEFYGDPVCPAHKYLSESQLNSFGLAVFFASVRYLNSGFPFLLLDDVINSLDAYKRPRVIDLLHDEFRDYQVLLLTHDDVWYVTLCDRLQNWNRLRIRKLVRSVGPLLDSSTARSLDRVLEHVDADRSAEAGGCLGPYLERQLQQLCYCFEAMVKYNPRNEYTLRELLQYLRRRVKDKLGSQHGLSIGLTELEETSGFRNFCAHWKETPSQVSSGEIGDVLDKWQAVYGQTFCVHCGRYAEYDGAGGFRCACSEHPLTLTRQR